jgi:hypothetical protein
LHRYEVRKHVRLTANPENGSGPPTQWGDTPAELAQLSCLAMKTWPAEVGPKIKHSQEKTTAPNFPALCSPFLDARKKFPASLPRESPSYPADSAAVSIRLEAEIPAYLQKFPANSLLAGNLGY